MQNAEAERLYIYHVPAQRDSQTYYRPLYGLVSHSGNMVLPREYIEICKPPVMPVYGNPYTVGDAQHPSLPPEQTYYIAARSENEWALISPLGELLTGEEYAYIFATENPHRHIAVMQVQDGWQCVWIEADGSTTPVLDDERGGRLLDLEQQWSVHLADGRYWELTGDSHEESFHLHSPNGELLFQSTETIYEIERIGPDRFLFHREASGEIEQRIEVCNGEGSPILPDSFSDALVIHPYLITNTYDETQTVIYDLQTLEEILRTPYTFVVNPEIWFSKHQAYIALEDFSSYESPAIQHERPIFDLKSGEIVPFLTDGEVELLGVEYGGNRLLATTNAFTEYSNNITRIEDLYIFNAEGNLLQEVEGEFSLCHNRYLLTDTLLANGRLVCGLLSLQGDRLLPDEFSSLTLLEEDAFFAVRGDECGIVNTSGEWLFRESVYQYLMD